MESKFAKISNKIFLYLVFFLITFAWCNCYYTNFLGCVIVSIIVASILSFATTKIFYVKQEKQNIKQANQKLFFSVTTNLMFLNYQEQVDYFFKVISFSYSHTEKTKEYIKLNNAVIIPLFNFELTANEFLDVYKKHKNKNQLIILTNKLSNQLEELLSKLEISNLKILCASDTFYKIIEPTKIYPENLIKQKPIAKLKFKELLFIAFNKRNTKNYFFSGLILMVFSFVYRYSLYYQIVATILFLFSLFSYFNVKYNPPTPDIFNNKKSTE